jgi:hypothetical protein
MIDWDFLLALVIWALTLYAWLSAIVLIRVARHRPRIGTLTERAIVAVCIALFGTAYSLLMLNTEFLDIVALDQAIVFVRAFVVVLLTIPAWWSWMLLTGRLTRVGGKDDEP